MDRHCEFFNQPETIQSYDFIMIMIIIIIINLNR